MIKPRISLIVDQVQCPLLIFKRMIVVDKIYCRNIQVGKRLGQSHTGVCIGHGAWVHYLELGI